MKLVSNNISELSDVASNIVNFAGNKRVILFNGEMGAGKTTLIKEICLKLGVEENVSSPTFGIVNEYVGLEDNIFHFDAYRIEDGDEALDIGVDEYLYSGNWCLLEWPEKIASYLPDVDECVVVDIELELDKRIYTLK